MWKSILEEIKQTLKLQKTMGLVGSGSPINILGSSIKAIAPGCTRYYDYIGGFLLLIKPELLMQLDTEDLSNLCLLLIETDLLKESQNLTMSLESFLKSGVRQNVKVRLLIMSLLCGAGYYRTLKQLNQEFSVARFYPSLYSSSWR